jgi:glucose/arabinose dehydrogenase
MKRNLVTLTVFFLIVFLLATLFIQLTQNKSTNTSDSPIETVDTQTTDDIDPTYNDDAKPGFVLATDISVPELEITQVIAGLDHPWDIGFLPTGEMVFTERSNKLNVARNGVILKTFTFNDAYVRGEGGVLGLAVDPEFSSNRYIYVCLNSTLGNNPEVRVARLQLSTNLNEISNRTDIVTGIPSNDSGRHSGCQLDFGPLGNLWIGTGDTATDGTIPQDPKNLGGKILRVTRDGKAPAGNLPEPFDPRIFSYGHRNVQGLVFLPKDLGFVPVGVAIEQGPSVADEVNILSPGNFGWNPVPGYNESVPMTDLAEFKDAHEALYSTPGRTYALSGGTVIVGEQWGSLQGVIVAAALKDEKLTLIRTDKNGKFITMTNILEGQYGRLRTAEIAPDGSMYVLSSNGGNDSIYKIVPK